MERMNPVMNGRNSVRLTAVDIMGKQWPLIYYTRPNGNPCPVLRWCQLLNDRPVLRGDKLIFSRQQDAGEMRYMIQVKRRTKTREGETVDVEVVKSPTPMTFRGVLDSNGYKVTMEGGVLKVVRGAFLAMKGTRQRNLYFLDGYIVTGRAAVSSSSDDEASDTFRLWHMRLGHVGEKALQGLVKQGLLKGAKTAYFHVTESKLDPRAKKAIFVGFSEGVKGFRLWNFESKKIILSRDVEFEFPKKSKKASPIVDGPDDQDEISVEVEDSAPLSEIRQQPESIATSRPKRDIRKPARYTDMMAYALLVTVGDVSYTYREARGFVFQSTYMGGKNIVWTFESKCD
ncbi:hypothetical protein LWI28_007283 [Acer negundo]|uniref:Retroviral polymerase SH3-like domain-containing protein n=1 Tax=Acer negundo TaxID=4023 RepID=A0AAD5NV23_ACENE|nr:hypothetical protein LWI28_007283 [Acer negundo]